MASSWNVGTLFGAQTFRNCIKYTIAFDKALIAARMETGDVLQLRGWSQLV